LADWLPKESRVTASQSVMDTHAMQSLNLRSDLHSTSLENSPKSKRDEDLGWQLKPGPVRVQVSYNRLAVDQTLHMHSVAVIHFRSQMPLETLLLQMGEKEKKKKKKKTCQPL
jgi:hypothetical protein